MFFIITAAILISTGTFIISNNLNAELLKNLWTLGLSNQQITSLGYFIIGIVLNFTGSLCWAIGRQSSISYSSAWNTYLGLLIISGTLIGIIVTGDKITATKLAGLLVMCISIFMING